MTPLLQLPEVPGSSNWLWRRRISLEEQLKAVPVHSVVPPPIMLHVNVSTWPVDVQLTFTGTCNTSISEGTNH